PNPETAVPGGRGQTGKASGEAVQPEKSLRPSRSRGAPAEEWTTALRVPGCAAGGAFGPSLRGPDAPTPPPDCCPGRTRTVDGLGPAGGVGRGGDRALRRVPAAGRAGGARDAEGRAGGREPARGAAA